MKKFTIIFFLLSINALGFSIMLPDVKPINAKVNAMGNTAMIFGEEYGALFSSPTAISSARKYFSLGLAFSPTFNTLQDFKGFFSIHPYFKIENFAFGFALKGDFAATNYYKLTSASYSFNIGTFSIGANAKAIFSSPSIGGAKFENVTFDIGSSYNSKIGIFALAINDIFAYNTNISAVIRNLNLGYGKKFIIGKKLNNIKLAIELNNLLMYNTADLNKYDFDFTKKLKIGSEFEFLFKDLTLDVRAGLALLPTLGVGVKLFKDILNLEYSLSTSYNSDKFDLLHAFSLRAAYSY